MNIAYVYMDAIVMKQQSYASLKNVLPPSAALRRYRFDELEMKLWNVMSQTYLKERDWCEAKAADHKYFEA